MGREGDLSSARKAFLALQQEMARLEPELADLLKEARA